MSHLRRQTSALLEADALLESASSDAVHAARVAARRLRSGLRLYGDLLLEDVSARLRPELSWYAGQLSPTRDLEVFALWLSTPAPDSSAEISSAEISSAEIRTALIPWLQRERDRAVREALIELRSERARSLRGLLVAVARAPRFTATASKRASKVLAPRVLRVDQRAARPLGHLRPDDAPEAWHSARIGAKRARYAAEVGAPALGRPCVDLAHLWALITEPLGQAQDATIQRDLVLARLGDTSVPISAVEAIAVEEFVRSTRIREVTCHEAARDVWLSARDEHTRLRRTLSGRKGHA